MDRHNLRAGGDDTRSRVESGAVNVRGRIARGIQGHRVLLVLELGPGQGLVQVQVALLEEREKQVVLLQVEQAEAIHAHLQTTDETLNSLGQNATEPGVQNIGRAGAGDATVGHIGLEVHGEGVEIDQGHGQTNNDETA